MNPLIVALDVPAAKEAVDLAERLGDAAGHVKVGLELFAAEGPDIVRAMPQPVFLDLKLHDIPNTVAGAVHALAPLAPSLLTVHALGGDAMMRAAVEAKPSGTRVLAVTILTSLDDDALAAAGLPPAATAVPMLARLAADAGCDGIVCAPTDLEAVREACPPPMTVVTPGIRPAGAALGDQARVATPKSAIAGGADYLVVGRPITRSGDPAAAARAILAEIEEAR